MDPQTVWQEAEGRVDLPKETSTVPESLERVADFLFETGALSRTPRSGFAFLGGADQSVAEHTAGVVMIGYVLAADDAEIDMGRLLKMCLWHDLPETRTSDLNLVSKQYVTANVEKALDDQTEGLPFGEEIRALVAEYEAGQTREAVLARDADQLELLLVLKEQLEQGNPRAQPWINNVKSRLRTAVAMQLAEQILDTESTRWWRGPLES